MYTIYTHTHTHTHRLPGVSSPMAQPHNPIEGSASPLWFGINWWFLWPLFLLVLFRSKCRVLHWKSFS